ncbi:MAG: manganese efflux pump [Desulfobulbaceae bacterium]|nr:manganese efflux pump [Desulfobulbaceae bacterium]
MNIVEIILIAAGLAMDASAVSLAAAASGYADTPRAVFRLSFHFGLFQFLMPIAGWFIGRGVVSFISSIAPWVAFGLLTFVGARMIQSGITAPSNQDQKNDPSRGLTLVMLSLATSIDALAIGLSFAMLDVDILIPSLIIGGITILLSLLAIQVGSRLGTILGQRMELVGGIILVAIGIKIVLPVFLSTVL